MLTLSTHGCTTFIKLPPATPNVTTRIPIPARIELPEDTAATDLKAGGFQILIGQAVVQYAHAYLTPVFPAGDVLVIGVRIHQVSEQHYRVYVALEFSASRQGHEVFRRAYDATGTGNYWDAMMNPEGVLRESANVALRSVFKQFLSEAEGASVSW